MHGRRRERTSILVAVALCALAWPAGASAISQTVTSSGEGMWLSGQVGSGSAVLGYGEDPDFGGLVSYSLTLVDVGGNPED